MRVSNLPIFIFVGITAASCSVQGPESAPTPLTEKQASILTKALKGRIAGDAVNCVSNNGSTNFTRVSDDILIYQLGGRTVYQNKLPYSCQGLERGDDIMVFETFGSRYCKGDIVRLVGRFSGIQGPICRLGEFVPYKKSSG